MMDDDVRGTVEIKSIPIDPDGRYILICSQTSAREVEEILRKIGEWWESDERLLLLYSSPSGPEFHLERVGSVKDNDD